MKRVLSDILGSRRVTEEVLGRTLCLVEQALNSRPITPVSTDSREVEALTQTIFCLDNMPQAFLHFYPGSTSITRKGTCDRNHMLTRFGLVGLEKWHTHSDFTLKTGDLVWVIVPDSPRGYCPLARIVKRNYGQDRCARSALVRTGAPVESRGRPLSSLRFFLLQGGRMMHCKCRV